MGNKRRIAQKLLEHFPPASTIDLYIEPFFGAGGMFFSKDKSKYNILNDTDSEVYNLFCVLMERSEELHDLWLKLPVHLDLFLHWKEHVPHDPVMKAARFLFMSNFTYLCKGGTFMWNRGNASRLLLERITSTHEMLFGCEFSNYDFREMFQRVKFRDVRQRDKSFIYADPPYLDTDNNYKDCKWTKDDVVDLFDVLESTGARFALSEFDHPFVLSQARDRGLRVIEVGTRKNIANRRLEIAVINY